MNRKSLVTGLCILLILTVGWVVLKIAEELPVGEIGPPRPPDRTEREGPGDDMRGNSPANAGAGDAAPVGPGRSVAPPTPDTPKFEPLSEIEKDPFDAADPERLARYDVPERFTSRRLRKDLRRYGGGMATESGKDLALYWLSKQQLEDGSWEGAPELRRAGAGEGAGYGGAPAASALAILAFLGSGESHLHGNYKRTVRRGLTYLLGLQARSGCIGADDREPRSTEHALGTLALVEAWALTGSSDLRAPATMALEFLCFLQNPGGAWGRGLAPCGVDPVVTSWVVYVLDVARAAGLWIDPGISAATERHSEGLIPQFAGRKENDARSQEEEAPDGGPTPPADRNSTAALLFGIWTVRADLREETWFSAARSAASAASLGRARPDGNGTPDILGMFFSSMLAFGARGETWREWNRDLKLILLPLQKKGRGESGSWNPEDLTAAPLGKVATTALAAMCLETYYRYRLD